MNECGENATHLCRVERVKNSLFHWSLLSCLSVSIGSMCVVFQVRPGYWKLLRLRLLHQEGQLRLRQERGDADADAYVFVVLISYAAANPSSWLRVE